VHVLTSIRDVLAQQLHRQQRTICRTICWQFQPYCQRQPPILVDIPASTTSSQWAAEAALGLLL
jgi:hypothetical protein